MSEHIGGKGSGASSSSEFLRAYRTGIIAGANASYQTIPKKAAKSYATTTDLLEARNQRGVLADLSSVIVTQSTCPPGPRGPIPPLVYVSNNVFATLPGPPTLPDIAGITYTNDGVYVSSSSQRAVISANTLQPIINNMGSPGAIMQSQIDGKVYVFDIGRRQLIQKTIGGLGSTVFASGFEPQTGRGIAQDNLGNFYITGGYLYKVTPLGVVSILSPFNCTGITYASDGNLYVTSSLNGIWRFNTNGQGVKIIDNYEYYYGIIQANDGYLYVGTSYGIYRLSLDGELTLFSRAMSIVVSLTQGADENFYTSRGYTNVLQIVVR